MLILGYFSRIVFCIFFVHLRVDIFNGSDFIFLESSSNSLSSWVFFLNIFHIALLPDLIHIRSDSGEKTAEVDKILDRPIHIPVSP